MKKFITIILIAIMALSLSACRVDNTEDTTNKGSQETENTINLDDCYVCSVWFDDTILDNGGFISHNNYDIFENSQGGDITGYYIQGNVIYTYWLARIDYDKNTKQYKVYDWGENSVKIFEYHGVNNYVVRVTSYLSHDGCMGVWTWGELKQHIEDYNSTHGE